MKLFKVLAVMLILSLVASTGFASLLNTTDQVNNANPALGGNPAVRAYTQVSNVEAGLTLLTSFWQSKTLLDKEFQGNAANGSNVDPMNQMSNLFLQYSLELPGANWLTVKYNKSSDTVRSFRQKAADEPKLQSIQMFQDRGTEVIAADVGRSIGKGAYVGAELAANKYFETDYQKPNSYAKRDLNLRQQDITAESLNYFSATLGGIMELNNALKVSVAQKAYSHRVVEKQGKSVDKASKYNLQYTEELAPETAIGLLYKINNRIELGGTMQMAWDRTYFELGNRFTNIYSGPETDTEVRKVGFTTYTLNGEIAWMPDLLTQAYYGWALDANRVITDQDAVDRLVGQTAVDITNMGINIIKSFGDHTIVGGLARSTTFKKYDDDNDVKYVLDQTKVYLDYAYAF
jgi:hypothetical protein